jgi:hypothetical protein
MASDSRDPGSDLWLHRPDMWSGLVLAVALAGRSFRPSLMPRATPHQAIVAGASGAIGFGIGNVTYGAVARTGRTPVDLGLLAAAGGAGFAVSRLVPERDDEPEWRPIARAVGGALAAGAAAATLGVGVRGARPEHRHLAGATLTAVSGLTGTRPVLDGVRKQRLAHTERPAAAQGPARSRPVPRHRRRGLTTVVTTFRHTSAVVGHPRTTPRRARDRQPLAGSRHLGRAWYVSGKALADLFVNGLRTYDRVVDAGFDRAPPTRCARRVRAARGVRPASAARAAGSS